MEEWGQNLLIAAIIIVLGWFTLGLTWNLRKGNALLRWMQAGLTQLGERTTMRWLGTPEVELLIGDYSKAEQKLGWEPKTKFADLARLMVDADVELLRRPRAGEVEMRG